MTHAPFKYNEKMYSLYGRMTAASVFDSLPKEVRHHIYWSKWCVSSNHITYLDFRIKSGRMTVEEALAYLDRLQTSITERLRERQVYQRVDGHADHTDAR